MNIKMSELLEDIRTDLMVIEKAGYSIEEKDRASDRLTVNANELRKRASKADINHQAWLRKLARYGF